ncbi:MAG: hypothetical protein H9535_14660 [Ignavibacteria bacterium]|nr:hypothetical protein [Ignavibacteria bacterium]
MKPFTTIFLLFYALLLTFAPLFGQQQKDVSLDTPPGTHVFVLPTNIGHLEIGADVQYYEDKEKTLTFDAVAAPAMASRWKSYDKQTLSFGFKRSAYWLRFALRNPSPQQNDWLLEIVFPTLDSIELYSPHSDGHYTHYVMGDYLPFSRREFQYRTFIKRLDMPDSQPQVYYLKVSTTSSTIIPIILHRNDEFITYSNHWQFFYGWLLGALMILIAYHIILFAFTRAKSYVFYVLYMCGVVFYTATFNGFTAQYVLPESGNLLQYSMMLSIGLALLGLVLFTRAFLNTKEFSPRFDIVLRGLAIYLCVVSVAVTFTDYLTTNIILSSSLLPVVVICYGAALRVAWRVRSYQHLYFLVGSFSLMFGGALTSLMTIGILPNTIITRNSVQFGAIMESLLFSLALSLQYKILQQEKARAQEENYRLIRDANETLRRAVEERTAELQEKNGDLETANEEIQRQMEIQTDQAREIELANTTLQEQNEKLNDLNKEKNEIIGIVAHDLKNPISAVHGLAELVQSGFAEPEQVPEITRQIVVTADRMLQLVRNLLDVNRLESGTVQFNFVEFDIVPMVEATLAQYTPLAEAKNITLHYHKETDSSTIIADEQATMQILDNLISNAVKYSPLGKQVFMRVSSSSSFIRLAVEDEGPGLSEDDKSKLFGKFARLSARPTAGEYSTGLGLSIVKKMVEAMNGRVWCESELGKGAAFIVELPIGKNA